MPKKTKKQKIIAEARRIIGSHQESGNTISVNNIETHAEKKSMNSAHYVYSAPEHHEIPAQSLKESEKISKEFHLIRKDLLKTVLIAGIMMVSEIALSVVIR